MTKVLLEADNFTIDLRTIYNRANAATAPEEAVPSGSEVHAEVKSASEEDAKIAEILQQNGIADLNIIKKIIAFGDPLKKIIQVLGSKSEVGVGGNPILAFIKQDYVQEQLIAPGLLNANKFRAIYNALVKKLVAQSEFFEDTKSDCNIMYCKDLYSSSRSTKEIEEYLTLQREMLPPAPSSGVYTTKEQILNKKVFLYINDITETDAVQRAELVRKYNKTLPQVTDAKLNDLSLARLIKDKGHDETVHIKTEDQDAIIAKLYDNNGNLSIANALVIISTLSMNTGSEKIKAALASQIFTKVTGQQIVTATTKLVNKGILPNGQINTADANSLVDKIMAKLQPAT